MDKEKYLITLNTIADHCKTDIWNICRIKKKQSLFFGFDEFWSDFISLSEHVDVILSFLHL